jgi:cell division protein FtsN
VKGERIYRLMVGQFKTRAEADAFRAKVAQNFPDCFIVEFK